MQTYSMQYTAALKSMLDILRPRLLCTATETERDNANVCKNLEAHTKHASTDYLLALGVRIPQHVYELMEHQRGLASASIMSRHASPFLLPSHPCLKLLVHSVRDFTDFICTSSFSGSTAKGNIGLIHAQRRSCFSPDIRSSSTSH